MVARFLSFYPQYTLEDLQFGGLSPGDFMFLYAGMLDITNPEATEPKRDKIWRLTVAAHKKAGQKGRPKKKGW